MTIPMAVVLPTAALAVNGAKAIMAGGDNGTNFAHYVTGMDAQGKFHADWIVGAYGPIIGGALVHYAAGRFGVNRALGRAKIPLIRI
jgi:hypothetical protein